MKRLLSLTVLSLMTTSLATCLSGCEGAKKTKSFVELTTKLASETSASVKVARPTKIENFGNQIEFVKKAQTAQIEKLEKYTTTQLYAFGGKAASLPLIHKNHLYSLNENGILSAYNLDSKQLAWKSDALKATGIQSGGAIKFGSVSYFNEKLYVVTDMYMNIVDSHTGKLLAKTKIDDISRDYPAINHEGVYLKTASNRLLALRTEDLSEIWQYQTWSENVATPTVSSPILYKDIIIAGFSSGQLTGSGAKDGADLWQINLLNDTNDPLGFSPVGLASQPVMQNNNIIVASNANNLLKIDVETSKTVWKKKIEDITSMSVSGDIFVTNNARQLAAISSLDGSVMWVVDLLMFEGDAKSKPTLFTPPLVTSEGIFVFGQDGVGYLVGFGGKLEKRFSVPAKINSFMIYNDQILISDDRDVYRVQ